MPSTEKPLWSCPRCSRQFANRNQAHSCNTLTVHDCLKGKSEKTVELFHAFAAAVRSCGEVRIHPARSRIGFIARMTFAGVTLKRDHIEAGIILPYRSGSPRFHKFFATGTGGVHSLRLRNVADIDNEVRGWLREAYKRGLQQPDPPKLSKSKTPQTKAWEFVRRRPPGTGTAKVFYFHWNEQELEERVTALRKAGHEVRGHWNTRVVAKLGNDVPDIVVISLDRLPSHGRAYAAWIWEAKKRRTIPIIFAGGEPDKVLLTKHQFPDAIFCASKEVPKIIERLVHR